MVFVLVGLLVFAAPGTGSAQTEVAPTVVQSLHEPAAPTQFAPWIGATAGTAFAVVAVNTWTGGALLAPALGPALSGVLGGSLLGLSAMSPLAARSLFETTSLIAVGVAGGVFGHWVGSW